MTLNRIVVLRPNHRLGNTLLLSPLVGELERRFPGAQIDLVTACSDTGAVFERYPQVSGRAVFPTHSYRHPGAVLGVLASLRRQTYDLAIDPIPRSRAGRFLLAFVRARERLGYRWGVWLRDFALTRAVDLASAPAHFAQAPLHLLRSLEGGQSGSGSGGPDRDCDPELPRPLDLRLSDAERREGEQRLASALAMPVAGAPAAGAKVVGLFAHATGAKGFPLEWWLQIVSDLRRQMPAVQLLEFIPADRRARLAGSVPGLYTRELRLLGATLAAASLIVIGDGGVMHVADAAGARVLGLFRSTDPARYGPCGSGSQALWAADASTASVAERIGQMLNERGPRSQVRAAASALEDQRYGSSLAR